MNNIDWRKIAGFFLAGVLIFIVVFVIYLNFFASEPEVSDQQVFKDEEIKTTESVESNEDKTVDDEDSDEGSDGDSDEDSEDETVEDSEEGEPFGQIRNEDVSMEDKQNDDVDSKSIDGVVEEQSKEIPDRASNDYKTLYKKSERNVKEMSENMFTYLGLDASEGVNIGNYAEANEEAPSKIGSEHDIANYFEDKDIALNLAYDLNLTRPTSRQIHGEGDVYEFGEDSSESDKDEKEIESQEETASPGDDYEVNHMEMSDQTLMDDGVKEVLIKVDYKYKAGVSEATKEIVYALNNEGKIMSYTILSSDVKHKEIKN